MKLVGMLEVLGVPPLPREGLNPAFTSVPPRTFGE